MYLKIKEFIKYLEKISFPILSSSITFYLLFMILPVTNIIINVLYALDIQEVTGNVNIIRNNLFYIISFFISFIWVSIRFMNALTISSDIIYRDVPPRKKIRRKILSFFLSSLFILLLVIQVTFILFVIYFIRNILKIKYLYFVHLLIIFLTTSFLSGIIYKYIIPVKIKFRQTFYMSSVVTLVWYILTLVYNLLTDLFQKESYQALYGNLANLMLLMFWLYLMVGVYLLGLALNYYISKKSQVINQEVEPK